MTKYNSKYPESLICHACHKAYAALRKHYGPDENDKKDPRGVEMAIRRDVIAVLEGATAKELHNRWANRKFGGTVNSATLSNVEFQRRTKENPTLGPWRSIPEVDKEGYRLFCRTVHEARREHEAAGFSALANEKFPQTFKITSNEGKVSKGGAPYGDFARPLTAYKIPGIGTCVVYALSSSTVPKTSVEDREQKRVEYCAAVAADTLKAYYGVNAFDLGFYAVSNPLRVLKVLTNPSAPALWDYDLECLTKKYGRDSLTDDIAWHQLDKEVQGVYSIFVAAVQGAAYRFDANNR